MNIILLSFLIALLVIGFFRFRAGKKQETQKEAEEKETPYETSQEADQVFYQEAYASEPEPVVQQEAPVVSESPIIKETKKVAPKKTSAKKTSGAKKSSPKKPGDKQTPSPKKTTKKTTK